MCCGAPAGVWTKAKSSETLRDEYGAASAGQHGPESALGSGLLQELVETSWEHVATVNVPGRQAQLFGIEDLGLGAPASAYLKTAFADGIYGHQKLAVKHFLGGEDVCMTTGTASGKSVPFFRLVWSLLEGL